MIRSGCLSALFSTALLAGLAVPASGQEYQVAKLDTPAPAAMIAPEMQAQLQSTGFKVTKGSATLCEVWLAKEWPIAADAKTGGEILYPLSMGELIGVIRYARKGGDFRDQGIPAGTYVLRYAQQPIDGAHVGTSPTRDFLALLPAAKDRDPKAIDYKALTETSKQTSGAAHPAILSLQKAEEGAEPLSIHEVSEKEWVVVHFVGKAKQGGASQDMPMELVVVGKAAE
jgi:hypothetical protein